MIKIPAREHPGYEASDNDIIDYWREYQNAPVSLIDEVIRRDLEFKSLHLAALNE